MPKKLAYVVYPAICCLHGALFGVLYAPAQAIMFGFDFEQTVAWIVAGLPFDLLHAIGDFLAGLFIVPLGALLAKLAKKHLGYNNR